MEKTNSGILLVNKELGMTSRQVSNILSKRLQIKKMGHLGTLDPLASGLLIIGVGEGTKVLPFLEEGEKTYVATFKLGLLTKTLDLEGEVLLDEIVEPIPLSVLKETIKKFIGEISQVPPLTSAIKVNGIRLYEYAHKGQEVEVPARNVTIHDIYLMDYIHPYFTIKARVSKGTYIRTLGEDIAKVLNTHATTVNLERIVQGNYELKNAKKLDDITNADIISIPQTLSFMKTYVLDEFQSRDVNNGKKVKLNTSDELVQVHNQTGQILAICRQIDGFYQPIRGFNL